jgi:ferric-dicitrate binding protein FerR (iron transport regulator)
MPVDNDEHQAILEASGWYGLMQSGHFGQDEHRAWMLWHSACGAHRRAWQLVLEVRGQAAQVKALPRRHWAGRLLLGFFSTMARAEACGPGRPRGRPVGRAC